MNIHLDVQPFQETQNAGMCGPASLKIVLGFFGVEKSEQELARLCKTDPDLGTDDRSIKAAAEELGFQVEIKDKSSFEDIEEYLSKGIPVIVNWFSSGICTQSLSVVPDGHYSVVSGIDDTHITLQDPEIGRERRIAKNDFLRVWFDFRGAIIGPNELIIRQIIAISKRQ